MANQKKQECLCQMYGGPQQPKEQEPAPETGRNSTGQEKYPCQYPAAVPRQSRQNLRQNLQRLPRAQV
jgi:hypothetical protein